MERGAHESEKLVEKLLNGLMAHAIPPSCEKKMEASREKESFLSLSLSGRST